MLARSLRFEGKRSCPTALRHPIRTGDGPLLFPLTPFHRYLCSTLVDPKASKTPTMPDPNCLPKCPQIPISARLIFTSRLGACFYFAYADKVPLSQDDPRDPARNRFDLDERDDERPHCRHIGPEHSEVSSRAPGNGRCPCITPRKIWARILGSIFFSRYP